MFLTDKKIRELVWYVAELILRTNDVEELMGANADAIEGFVTDLKAAEARIVAKFATLQAAVDAEEDLTGPLADLGAEVGSLSGVVPADAPVTPVADAPSV